jgi:hypothetical protein
LEKPPTIFKEKIRRGWGRFQKIFRSRAEDSGKCPAQLLRISKKFNMVIELSKNSPARLVKISKKIL